MRKPLMAGNWKMNLNHLEAIAVAQKLVYGLDDKDYDAVDVAIIPPFTDIRSIQTLVDEIVYAFSTEPRIFHLMQAELSQEIFQYQCLQSLVAPMLLLVTQSVVRFIKSQML